MKIKNKIENKNDLGHIDDVISTKSIN